MNTIPEQFFEASKDFRAFMRVQKGENGTFLSNLIDGAEIHLSRIIKEKVDENFSILYDNSISIEQLVRYYVTIECHEEWMTVGNGHTAWKSLRYYLDYRAKKEDEDWIPIYEKIKREFEKKKEEEQKRREKERLFKNEFTEGNIIDSHCSRHERDYRARLKCIEYYGCKCAICGFDFEERYGEIGKDFIEVHHIVPISSTDGEHSIDPIKDLIPVCSNCHSILHRQKPIPYSPDVIKQLINSFTCAPSGEND